MLRRPLSVLCVACVGLIGGCGSSPITGFRAVYQSSLDDGAIRPLACEPGWPDAFTFSPDGRFLACRIHEKGIGISAVLWEVTSGREILRTSGYPMRFAPDSSMFATSWKGKRKVYDLPSGGERLTIGCRDAGGGEALTFSPDGKLLAGIDYDEVFVWDMDNGAATKAPVPGGIAAIAFSPHGRTLAIANRDHNVCMWDIASGKVHRIRMHPGGPQTIRWRLTSLAFSPDGKVLIALWRGLLPLPKGMLARARPGFRYALWNIATGKEVLALPSDEHLKSSRVVLAPGGRTILEVSGKNTLRLWDTSTGRLRAQREIGGQEVRFSPDGTCFLAAAGWDEVHVCETSSGREIQRFKSPRLGSWECHAISSDGRTLAAELFHNTLCLVDLPSARWRQVIDWDKGSLSARLSPGGKHLAVRVRTSMGLVDVDKVLQGAARKSGP